MVDAKSRPMTQHYVQSCPTQSRKQFPATTTQKECASGREVDSLSVCNSLSYEMSESYRLTYYTGTNIVNNPDSLTNICTSDHSKREQAMKADAKSKEEPRYTVSVCD